MFASSQRRAYQEATGFGDRSTSTKHILGMERLETGLSGSAIQHTGNFLRLPNLNDRLVCYLWDCIHFLTGHGSRI